MVKGKLPRLPRRSADTHKGDYGKILVVAGSRGMVGAALLAAEAAYRGGAGLVTIGTPDSLVHAVSGRQTCAVVVGLPDQAGTLGPGAADEVATLLEKSDVLAMGPGLGAGSFTVEEVRQVVRTSPRPMVLDADALNAFADHPDLLGRGGSARVLTPHVVELARLTGLTPEAIRKDRRGTAGEAARRFLGVVVLKGHRTVITDGRRTAINATGNPGMATGGSGDVLTGLIAALLGQGLETFDAARLGAHLHGLAGDLAASKIGQVSLMATDLLAYLPSAIRKHQGRDA